MAIQLTHIGIDQCPMMTVHSMKIRVRWNSANGHVFAPFLNCAQRVANLS